MHDRLGDRRGQRFDVELARYLLQHAAFLDPRGVVGARELERHGGMDRLVEAHAEHVDVHRLPAHGVALGLLEHHRGRFGAVHAQVEHRSRGSQRDA